MLTTKGPGSRGSIPALVMRTGLIQPVDPMNARADIDQQHVRNVTGWPTNTVPLSPQFVPPALGPVPTVTQLPPAAPSPVTAAVAATVTATPPAPLPAAPSTPMPAHGSARHHWHLMHRHVHPMVADIKRLHPNANIHGAEEVELGEWNGYPTAKFSIAASPPRHTAIAGADALRRAAHALQRMGLGSLPPELVAGPLAALMRGGAIELHFQNGVVVRTAP